MPRVDPTKLRTLRERAGLTLEEAAEKVGYAVRSLSRAECGTTQPRAQTLRDLAKAYGTTLEDLFDAPAPPAPAPKAAAAKLDPPPTFVPQLSRLEAMVKATQDDPREAPRKKTLGGREAVWLSPAAFQAVFTAFALHDGNRFYVDATLDRHRGLSPEEAKALGTKPGVGARVLLTREAGGLPMSVTVHTAKPEHTRAVIERLGQVVRVVVKVVVVESRTFSFFGTDVPKEWALLVVAVAAPK